MLLRLTLALALSAPAYGATVQPYDLPEDATIAFFPGVGFRGVEECRAAPPLQTRKYEPERWVCEDIALSDGKGDLIEKWDGPHDALASVGTYPAALPAGGAFPFLSPTLPSSLIAVPPLIWGFNPDDPNDPPNRPPIDPPAPIPLPMGLWLLGTALLTLLLYRRLT